MDEILINIIEQNENVNIGVTETTELITVNVTEVLGRDGRDGTSGGSYVHVQSVPASIWNVNHNLGYKPGGLFIKDSANSQWWGYVTHVDNNNLTIDFNGASFAGEAIMS